MSRVKGINIKDRAYIILVELIDIKHFDQNNNKKDKKPFTNILICYTGFVTPNNDDEDEHDALFLWYD